VNARLDAELLRARCKDRDGLWVVDAGALAGLVAVIALAALLSQPTRCV
jgi:hypothetical protein